MSRGALMRNPSFDSGTDERAGADNLRGPLRQLQAGGHETILQDLRLRIHRKLIDTLDLTKVSNLETERVKVEIRRLLEDMVMAEAIPLSRSDRDRRAVEGEDGGVGGGALGTLM